MNNSTELKRVVDGIAYNTTTSQFVHEHPEDDASGSSETGVRKSCVQLFRTRTGQFFLAMRRPAILIEGVGKQVVDDMLVPIGAEHAMRWLGKHCPAKINELQELSGSDGTSTTFSLRMDESLKRALVLNAGMQKMSLNAWCVQALEKTLANRKPFLSFPASAYVEVHSGRRVLTDEGQPGMDGILGSGTPDELMQAALAAFIFNYPIAWTDVYLKVFMHTFSTLQARLEHHGYTAEICANMVAWLKLQERGTASVL